MTTSTSTRPATADRRRPVAPANAQSKTPARPTQAMQRRLVAQLVG